MFQKVDMYFETIRYSRVLTEDQGKNASYGILVLQDPKHQKYGGDILASYSFLHTSMHFLNVHLHYRC